MTLFFLTTRLPFPPRSGADLRAWPIIEAITGLGAVGVFGISSRPAQPAPTDGIALWQSSSHQAAIAHMSGPVDQSWLGIPHWRPSDWYHFPAIVDEVERALRDVRPDIVVLDGLMTAGYLALFEEKRIPVVLNAHNVEADLQLQIEQAESLGPARLIRRKFTERTRLLEADVLSRVDAVWVCSARDAELIQQTYAHVPPVTVVPNVVEPKDYIPAFERHVSAPPPQHLQLVFPAQFAYPPNRTAAWFLINELLPLFEDGSGTVLTLPGANPGEQLHQAAEQDPSLVVTGAVSDMLPYLTAADVMVVPLFEGSGTRLKILEAFAAGLPVIATAKAVEGLEVVDGIHLLMAETAGEFMAALDRLSDPGTYRRLVIEGRDLVEADYSPDRVRKALANSLTTLTV